MPKAGQIANVYLPTNLKQLYEEFKKKRGEEPNYNEKFDLWFASNRELKEVTVIRVSPKGQIMTVQDEEGRIIRYRYRGGFYFIENKDIRLFF